MKVAIVLLALVAVAAASPLLDAFKEQKIEMLLRKLEQAANRKGAGGGGPQGGKAGSAEKGSQEAGQGMMGGDDKKDMLRKKGDKNDDEEKEGLKKLEESISPEDYEEKFEEAVQKSKWFALKPISVEDLNEFRVAAAAWAKGVSDGFAGAAAAGEAALDLETTELQELDGMHQLIMELEKLGESSMKKTIDFMAVVYRVFVFGVGDKVVCGEQDWDCVMKKSAELEAYTKSQCEKFEMPGEEEEESDEESVEKKSEESDDEESDDEESDDEESDEESDDEEEKDHKPCNGFALLAASEMEGNKPSKKEYGVALAKNFACLSAKAKKGAELLSTNVADRDTTPEEVLQVIGMYFEMYMDVTKDVVGLSIPLYVGRHIMYQKMVAEGKLPEPAERMLARIVRNFHDSLH